MLGVAYKPDISDTRESPAVKLIGLLENAGADVAYHDPHVPSFVENGIAMSSSPLEPAGYDCVVVVTNHTGIDYEALVDEAALVVDLRNATGSNGTALRQGLEAVTVRVGQAGLGEWGKNLARNFADLADLAWLCDPAEGKADEFQSRYPQARWAESTSTRCSRTRRSTRSSSRPRFRRTTSSRSERSRRASTSSWRSLPR